MHRKRRRIGIALLFLLVLIGPPVWVVYRDMRQARLDQALIAAIKSEDNKKALEALTEGASGEARDTGKPASFREAMRHMLDHFRHRGVSYPTGNQERLPALLLLYQQASDTMPYAGSGPDLGVVRALLDHGAQVNDRESDGRTPLYYAACFSNDDTVRLLLMRGADPEAKNEFKDTPLMMADFGNTQVLLEHGANIEARDIEDMTPLMWAAKFGRSDVVRSLLGHGADMEAKDRHARTPLMLAARTWRSDVVRILLEHGAKLTPKDVMGHTVLDYVREDPDPTARNIAALLRKYGAK